MIKKIIFIIAIIIVLIVIAMVGYINREEMYIVTYSSIAKNEFISVFKDDNFISYEINLESKYDLNFYKLYVSGYEEMANLYDGFICDIEESEDYIKMKFKIDYSIIDEEGKKYYQMI